MRYLLIMRRIIASVDVTAQAKKPNTQKKIVLPKILSISAKIA